MARTGTNPAITIRTIYTVFSLPPLVTLLADVRGVVFGDVLRFRLGVVLPKLVFRVVLGKVTGVLYGEVLDEVLDEVFGVVPGVVLGEVLGEDLGEVLGKVFGVVLGKVPDVVFGMVLGEVLDEVLGEVLGGRKHAALEPIIIVNLVGLNGDTVTSL